MVERRPALETQKPRVGLLVCTAVFVFAGAGCADVSSALSSGASQLKTFTESTRTTVETWQKNVQKAKQIYDILHDNEPTTSDDLRTTPFTSTPSAQPSEDQPQPAAEENTSSQSQPQAPDASTDQSL